MKVVIDIPENDYWLACNHPDALISIYAHYIKKGVPLQEKHGRLIDADALIAEWKDVLSTDGISPMFAMVLESAIRDVERAKVVVEAEDK